MLILNYIKAFNSTKIIYQWARIFTIIITNVNQKVELTDCVRFIGYYLKCDSNVNFINNINRHYTFRRSYSYTRT